MRVHLVVLALLGAGFLAPVASAEPALTDAAGDAQYVPEAGGAPLPGLPAQGNDFVEANDLLALDVAETDDHLVLTTTVVDLEGASVGSALFVALAWNGESYRASFGFFRADGTLGSSGEYAYLQVREGDGWDFVAQLEPPVVDTAAGTLAISVPKVYLLDAQQRIPGRGDVVDVGPVETDPSFVQLDFVSVRIQDAMPDDGGAAAFALARGDFSQGTLVLGTTDRVRVSNGGATTFVFPVTMRNTGDAEDEYRLAIPDLPDGWNATFQSPVKVGAKGEKTTNLLVSVPFAHDHGGYSSFNLTVESARDAATRGQMRLGVLHTPIPQPAGHHSELYLHAEDPRTGSTSQVFSTPFPYAYGWMNTLSEHAEDAPFMSPNGFDDERTSWFIPLNPQLQMGLDFDLERLGSLEGAIAAHRAGEGEVNANLYYYRDSGSGGESILLAEGAPASVTLDQQAPTPFVVTLTPTQEADYLAYAPDTYVYLVVSITGALQDQFFNSPARVQLMTDAFKLTLPLNEYHDRLTGEADVAAALEVAAIGLVEKAGRPGTTLTYAFDVRNAGGEDVFTFDLAGNDVARATLVPSGDITLAAGETRRVTIAVEIPLDANDGEELEALLFVHARDDPSKMAIARTKTKVTQDSALAMPDETATLLQAQAAENETPGFAPWMLALALVVVALRRR